MSPSKVRIARACGRMEAAITALATVETEMVGWLPIDDAETMMENVEDLVDQLRTRLRGASAILGAELERLECAEAA